MSNVIGLPNKGRGYFMIRSAMRIDAALGNNWLPVFGATIDHRYNHGAGLAIFMPVGTDILTAEISETYRNDCNHS